MSRILLLTLVCALFVLPLAAQDYPKVEVFGGYQYAHLDGGYNANGWNASVTGNVNRSFGVTADFSGTYKTIAGVDTSTYTYTFGPVLTSHEGQFNPFVHFLAGGAHLTASVSGASASENGFSILAGGGVDAKINPRWSYRIAQVDWFFVHANGQSSSKNIRISTGIVARF